jgi:NitT/TauT family transport system permease protein/taurine transport system permease protein
MAVLSQLASESPSFTGHRPQAVYGTRHLDITTLLMLAMAIAFNAAIRWIERKAAIWQTGTRGGERAADEIAPRALQPAT